MSLQTATAAGETKWKNQLNSADLLSRPAIGLSMRLKTQTFQDTSNKIPNSKTQVPNGFQKDLFKDSALGFYLSFEICLSLTRKRICLDNLVFRSITSESFKMVLANR